jgi:hypothetical protein
MARIEITAKSTAKTYWIAVDDQDVDMRNDFGSVTVPSGDHFIYWGMYGAPGDKLEIEVKAGTAVLTTVPPNAIPNGWSVGGGVKPFSVP